MLLYHGCWAMDDRELALLICECFTVPSMFISQLRYLGGDYCGTMFKLKQLWLVWPGCAAEWLQCLDSMHGASDTHASNQHFYDCESTTQKKIRMDDVLPWVPIRRADLASKLCDSDNWGNTWKGEEQKCSKAQGRGGGSVVFWMRIALRGSYLNVWIPIGTLLKKD